jgi:hypothetical protein
LSYRTNALRTLVGPREGCFCVSVANAVKVGLSGYLYAEEGEKRIRGENQPLTAADSKEACRRQSVAFRTLREWQRGPWPKLPCRGKPPQLVSPFWHTGVTVPVSVLTIDTNSPLGCTRCATNLVNAKNPLLITAPYPALC